MNMVRDKAKLIVYQEQLYRLTLCLTRILFMIVILKFGIIVSL